MIPFAPSNLRSFLIVFLLAIFPQSNTFLAVSNQASAQHIFLADLEGRVQSKATSSPVSEAFVELPDFGFSTRTDREGHFSFNRLPIPDEVYPIQITIQAEGYGMWTMMDVRLVANDILLLEASLEREPITIIIPEINPDERTGPELAETLSLKLDQILDQRDLPLPETIRVRVTGNVAICNPNAAYTVQVVDFKQYVKNVLPNEWYVTWPRESLRAGAMAAKMYAWQLTAAGGRYDDADVFDSVCDQVYIPGVSYASTNNAINFTWNWRLTHADDGNLFRTHYLDWYWRCENYGWDGYCMGQWDTRYHAEGNNGYDKLTWDEMLFQYYWESELSYIPHLPQAGFSLRFYGNGWGDYDRVKFLLDDPQNGGLPVDIGDKDFTLEWWMMAFPAENISPACTPENESWMDGNVILDRDVPGDGDHGEYGVSLMNGKLAFGIKKGSASVTLCGSFPIADGLWHHVALTRNITTGLMRMFIDGELDGEAVGPIGDVSYRDGRIAQDPDQDPYLILGARKADQGLAFSGRIDEFRISDIIRYTDPFQRPIHPFISDQNTMALYHFDVGYGNQITDLSWAAEGPSNGFRIYGGDPQNGPEWEVSSLFLFQKVHFPLIVH